MITVTIVSTIISIMMTLYILATRRWPSGIPLIVGGCHVIYTFCFVGTQTEICVSRIQKRIQLFFKNSYDYHLFDFQNDDLEAAIYNIKWYYMTLGQKKLVRLMLQRSQKPSPIYIANIAPLTVSTACSVNIFGIEFPQIINQRSDCILICRLRRPFTRDSL